MREGKKVGLKGTRSAVQCSAVCSGACYVCYLPTFFTYVSYVPFYDNSDIYNHMAVV